MKEQETSRFLDEVDEKLTKLKAAERISQVLIKDIWHRYEIYLATMVSLVAGITLGHYLK